MEELKPSAANSSPLTPLGFLDRAATVYDDTPSIIYNDVTFTWSHTRRRCLQLASALSSLKISRGDVISVLAPNIPATYELHFAIPFASAIINIINPRLYPRTLSAVLRHAESKLVFVDIASRDIVLEALSLFPENNPHRPILILIEDDAVEVEPLSPSSTVHFEDTYEGLISKGDPNFKWLYPNSEWDPLRLNYTSGTTSSSPQGVVHSHRATYVMTVDSLMDWAVPKNPVFLWTVKMFHANGWCFPWGIAALGGTNICVRNFDAPSVFSLITRHRVTHMCASPVLLSMLAKENKPLENPVHILTAGAPPPPSVIQQTESLGFIVSHGYGLTETGGVVVSCAWKRKWEHLPAEERARLKARQGVRTLLTAEVDVVTSAGESVKHDGVTMGEVVIRGSGVMLGYLKNPESERTKNRLKNGYLCTGDVGVIHEDGYLEIKDRLNDVITSGGKIISSVEVESLLYMHPAVNEVAVVARPDVYCGQTACAFVSLKEGMVATEEEIIEHCKKNMATYMVPKTVAFREELPKSATGKIKKDCAERNS